MALEDAPELDACAGTVVGANELVCQVAPNACIALRDQTLVLVERLDGGEGEPHELLQHSEVMSKISHPNLTKVFGLERTAEGTFWVTEMVAGATLAEIRTACRKNGQSLPLGLSFATITEAALGLGELHGRSRAHGDVRDSQLLVTFSGVTQVQNAGMLDCVQHRAPDPMADAFALCGLLYECLTGQAPSGTAFTPPSSFNHALEPAIDEVLRRGLGPDPSKRFRSGQELAQALKAAAGAFTWKPAQRRELVTRLFAARHAREAAIRQNAPQQLAEIKAAREAERQAALALAAQEEAARAEALAAAERAQREAAEAQALAAAPVVSAPARTTTASGVSRPLDIWVQRARRRPALAAASAAIAVFGSVVLMRLLASDPASAHAAVVAPPMPVMVAPPPPTPEPPAASEPAPAPAAEPAVAPAEPPTAEDATEAPKVKKPKRKKSSNDAPIPPWLMRKGRR